MMFRYAVVAGKLSVGVELSERAEKGRITFGGKAAEAPGEKVGSALWEMMRAAGTKQTEVNHVALHEGDANGTLVATLHPVLEGARVVWLVLYRADKDAACFRGIGNRVRLGDALDLAFGKVAREIILPHKP